MKSCVLCLEHKVNSDFRKTKKTIDGLFPYCKQCAVMGRIENCMSFETICMSVWYDLQDLAFAKGAGTVIYTTKRIFMEYLSFNRRFKKLYRHWKEFKYGTVKLTVRLRHEQGNFEFANFEFFFRDLEEGETLKLVRNRPATRKS